MDPFSHAHMCIQTNAQYAHAYMQIHTWLHICRHIYMHTTYKTLACNYAHATHSKLCLAHLPLMVISTNMSVMQMHCKCIYIQIAHAHVELCTIHLFIPTSGICCHIRIHIWTLTHCLLEFEVGWLDKYNFIAQATKPIQWNDFHKFTQRQH